MYQGSYLKCNTKKSQNLMKSPFYVLTYISKASEKLKSILTKPGYNVKVRWGKCCPYK